MALRLTPPPTVAGGASPAPAAPPAAVPAISLTTRADALLAARDLAGWRALWAEAAAVEDVHRRTQARRALTQAVLAAPETRPAVAAPRFVALAAELITALEPDPAEPVSLNHLGVAFYELGAITDAERLFAAAQRLDPELPHVGANLQECARRRRAGTAAPRGLPSAAQAALRELSPRAARLARRARPAEGLTLSLCMIVKDEEATLGRCLASVRSAVDEIVVVDTGSTDATVTIAESFGARVLHHTWTGDFGEARNVSFAAATGDWVMYLDADEVLVAGDGDALRALTGRTWREAFYLPETNHTGDREDASAITHDALRVFRNRPQYRFEGRIHEQIAQHLPGYLPDRLERTGVRLEHDGYLGVVRDAKEKSRRNIDLLKRQAAEGDDTPFLHFNLGSEHAAAGEAEPALREFRVAWEALRPDPAITSYGFVPALATRLLKALRVSGRLEEVDALAQEALGHFPGLTDLVFEQAVAARSRGDVDLAAERFERCLAMGDAPTRYSPTVGCGTHLAQVALAEVRRDQGDLEGARELLLAALAAAPRHAATVEVLAGVELARGRTPAEVVADVVAMAGDDLRAPGRFVLAVVVYERGAAAEAEGLLRDVLAAQPGAEPARVALAEALLSQDRLPEAAATAAAVPGTAAVKAAALRTELFCLLADGRPAGDALAAADGVLPADELAALDAWAGTAPAAAVPATAVEPVTVMLDALARLERFDAFELLAGVLTASATPERERREALAQVYLRRGFVDSAADEWITVVRELGADAAALRGLATVAVAQGLPEDAELLTREAAALAA